jgi:hypothetical protein
MPIRHRILVLATTILLGGGLLAGGATLVTTFWPRSSAPPTSSQSIAWLQVDGPDAMESEASAGAEAPVRLRAAPGTRSLRILPGDPLRVVRGCPETLPEDGTCEALLRLPAGPPEDGVAQVVVTDAEDRRTTFDVRWRRRPDPFAVQWEPRRPARPESPGEGRLWIVNRSDAARALPVMQPPSPLFLPAETPSENACPDALPPQGRCALTLRWSGAENGTRHLRLQVPGAAPVEAAIAAEGYDPIPRLSPLAPFVADPTLGAARQTLQVANAGTGPLSLAPAVIEGDGFAIDASTCPERLPPGLSCALDLSFRASADALTVGRLRLGQGVEVALHGKADGFLPRLSFEGESTAVAVAGDAPPVLRIAVRLRNLGSRPSDPVEVRHLGAPLPGGAWAWERKACPALAPGEACELVQEGSAAEDGTAETRLEAPGAAPHVLRWAVSNLSPSLSADPPGVFLLERGVQEARRSVHLRNAGNAPARLAPSVEGTGFMLAGGTCPQTLPPRAACTIDLAWRPAAGLDSTTGRLIIAPGMAIDLMGVRR